MEVTLRQPLPEIASTPRNELFQPLKITDKVKDLYFDYITGTFPLDHPVFTDQFNQVLQEEGTLWNGPFISLARNYKFSERPASDILRALGIGDTAIQAFSLERLFLHQEQAIRSVLAGKHTVLSTGTGSGKTEAFLIPIVDYCIKVKAQGKQGLKAIIIYPMNALANDQHERLRRILYEVNLNQRNKVTFARYTGATPRSQQLLDHPEKFPPQRCPLTDARARKIGCLSYCPERVQFQPDRSLAPLGLRCQSNQEVFVDYELLSRDDIEKSPADILITNYVQLEYLLLGKVTEKIFSAPHLKFIVFDEIHTYAGARGIEVALLLRRLRERLRALSTGEIVHIGTSATISSAERPAEEIARFAKDFFGLPIGPENVIVGETTPHPLATRQHLPPTISIPAYDFDNGNTPEDLNRLVESLLPAEALRAFVKGPTPTIEVGRALVHNAFFAFLVRELIEPRSIDDLVAAARDDSTVAPLLEQCGEAQLKELAWKYLVLGSQTSDPELSKPDQELPLIRPNVHIFFRTIGQDFPFGELFVCLGCNRFHDGVALNCVSCGNVLEELGACRGCGRTFFKGYYDKDLSSPTQAMRDAGIEKEFGLKRVLTAESPTVWFIDSEIAQSGFVPAKKCKKCGFLCSEHQDRCPEGHNDWIRGSASRRISRCPYCDYSGGQLEAVSPIYLSPNVTSRIIFEFVFSLLPEKQRRLLVFSDSRQDASYLAGTIEYEHKVHMLRQIAYQALRSQTRPVNVETLHGLVDAKMQEIMREAYTGWMQSDLKADVLLELSTVRARRKSLESLGLLKIDYRGLPEISSWLQENPDDSLAKQLKTLQVEPALFSTYLAQILHGMRHDGALDGLEKVPGFGREAPTGYTVNPRASGADAREYIIKQPFQPRSSLMVLTRRLFPNADPAQLLSIALNYLQRRTYISEREIGPRPRRGAAWPKGWVVSTEKMLISLPEAVFVCPHCRAVSFEPLPICLAYRCHGGIPQRKSPEDFYRDATAFHIQWYRHERPVRLLADEDTGALATERRQRVESNFKAGKTDLIACTPTLELGIDIGDLVAVAMAKFPPSPANYVQRAGRAGRQAKISLITSFAFQSKIDQFYFNSPGEMIRGRVRPPFVSLENRTLVKRHVYSSLLEDIFVLGPNAHEFLEGTKNIQNFIGKDHLVRLESVLQSRRKGLVERIRRAFGDIPWLDQRTVEDWVGEFPSAIRGALEEYQREVKELETLREQVAHRINELRPSERRLTQGEYWERERLRAVESHIDWRLDSPDEGLRGRNTIQQFAASGVTPRYAFPGKQLQIITTEQESAGERQMSTGIGEVVPGAPVYFRKKKFLAVGFDLIQQGARGYSDFSYCNACKTYAVEGQGPKECPLCKGKSGFTLITTCISPSVAVIRPMAPARLEAREYTRAETDHFLMRPAIPEVDQAVDTSLGKLRRLGRVPILTIVYALQTNDGRREFNICQDCGLDLTSFSAERGHRMFFGGRMCNGRPPQTPTRLFNTFETESVALEIPESLLREKRIPVARRRDFLISLANALVGGIELMASASEGEVGYLLKENPTTLIFFDNVEGGVGFVTSVSNRFEELLNSVAGRLLSDCQCEVGCPRCLYSYRRKADIGSIDKRLIAPLFRELRAMAAVQGITKRAAPSLSYEGFNIRSISSPAGSLDGAIEVRDLLLGATQSIDLVCLYVLDTHIPWPDGSTSSWVGVLTRCALNRVRLRLIVRSPQNSSEIRSLKKLREAGIEVLVFPRPDIQASIADSKAHLKQIAIDVDSPERACAIHMSANLSGETQKNIDFYDFGFGADNIEWIRGTREFIERIAKDAVPYRED